MEQIEKKIFLYSLTQSNFPVQNLPTTSSPPFHSTQKFNGPPPILVFFDLEFLSQIKQIVVFHAKIFIILL